MRGVHWPAALALGLLMALAFLGWEMRSVMFDGGVVQGDNK